MKIRSITIHTVLFCFAAEFGVAQAPQQQGASPQEMLDFLAKPASIAGRPVLPAGYPSRFAEWDDAQKKAGLQSIALRCGLLLGLEHDNPAARMLPEPMTSKQESRLGVDVCLITNIPVDWPDRGKYLDDAEQLIGQANTHGSTLHLPASLKR